MQRRHFDFHSVSLCSLRLLFSSASAPAVVAIDDGLYLWYYKPIHIMSTLRNLIDSLLIYPHHNVHPDCYR